LDKMPPPELNTNAHDSGHGGDGHH
jgi:hypothetical protein